MTIHVIGVPFNSAGTTDGVARAPGALREAGLLGALRDAGLDVVDRGDVALATGTPARDPKWGLIAPDALGGMIPSVRAAVAESTGSGAFPLVLGGDCPVLLGCLAAIAAPDDPPGLLFVDGHEDAWPPHASTTGEAADMELGLLLGRSPDGLPASIREAIPSLDRGRVVVVGARDQDELAAANVPSIEGLVDVVRTEGVAGATVDRVLADRVRGLNHLATWWLHVDLDVLSSESLSAVDYPQPGGLDWEALTAVTRRALAGGPAGFDVTIYNPDLDPDRDGARAIVRYLAAALGARHA
jgi:arginase